MLKTRNVKRVRPNRNHDCMIFPRIDARPPRADHSHKETPRRKTFIGPIAARECRFPAALPHLWFEAGLRACEIWRAAFPSSYAQWLSSAPTLNHRCGGSTRIGVQDAIRILVYRTCFPIIPDRRSQPGHLEPRCRECKHPRRLRRFYPDCAQFTFLVLDRTLISGGARQYPEPPNKSG
jgi:hypothetical protein